MTNATLKDLITPSEAAALRAVTRQAIDDLIKRKKLKTWEIGGRVFVSRTAVVNYQPAPAGRPPKAQKKKAGKASARQTEDAEQERVG